MNPIGTTKKVPNETDPVGTENLAKTETDPVQICYKVAKKQKSNGVEQFTATESEIKLGNQGKSHQMHQATFI